MNGIKILGTGRGVPSKLVTNEDMAKIVDTNDEWITTRTGITHRHHLAEGETITDMTVLAARRALENAGISADQIGACIVATLTPDTLVPSAACCLQREPAPRHRVLRPQRRLHRLPLCPAYHGVPPERFRAQVRPGNRC